MSKLYVFTDDSWWDDNGCSCCEPHLMPCFNIDREYHPNFTVNHSCHSEEECWESVLIHEGILDEYWEWYKDLDDDTDEGEYLSNLLRENRLKVVIRVN